MKRILTALLCVLTIISTVGSPAFGVGEIKFSQDYDKAVSVLSYIGIFVAIFVSVWLIQYFCWKRKIKKMNSSLK